MYDDYLAHHGIKGQKWGIRRYQNKDGTLTELGKKRKEQMDKWFTQSIKGGKDKPPVSPAEKVSKEAANTATEVQNIGRTINKMKPQDRTSKHMTDEELRKRIARLELEKRYDSLSAEDVSRGKLTFDDVMSIVGSTLAVAASAATIYATIKENK